MNDLQISINKIRNLAFRLVLAGDFAAGLAAADQAVALAPDRTWIAPTR